MTNLKWHQESEDWVSGEYRVQRDSSHSHRPWRLDASSETARQHGRDGVVLSFHASLSDAKRAAGSHEQERLEQVRVVGHVVVGVLASGVFAALVPIVTSVPRFVIAVVAVYVAVRSFTFAISIKLGDSWGWTRDGGLATPSMFTDRAILIGARFIPERPAEILAPEPSGAVNVLPLDRHGSPRDQQPHR